MCAREWEERTIAFCIVVVFSLLVPIPSIRAERLAIRLYTTADGLGQNTVNSSDRSVVSHW